MSIYACAIGRIRLLTSTPIQEHKARLDARPHLPFPHLELHVDDEHQLERPIV